MATTFTLVTLSTPDIASYALLTENNKRNYCKTWGYKFWTRRSPLDGRHPAWSKLLLLLDAFDKCVSDWYFWLDADAAILNQSTCLASFINPGADIVVAHDSNGFNSGSFFIRRSERTAAALREAYTLTQFLVHPWNEQPALAQVIYSGSVPLNILHSPQRDFNAYLDGDGATKYRHGDFVLHLPGLSTDARTAILNRHLLGFDFSCRERLPALLISKLGSQPLIGAEIGVQTGLFSEFLLSFVNIKRLFCIDIWREIPGRRDISNEPLPIQQRNYQMTTDRLSKFAPIPEILREESKNAASRFSECSLDFVYIDADHSYSGCLADIRAYYPKVKHGGLMCGHDFLDGALPEGEFGVRSAVLKFLDENPDLEFCATPGPWGTWVVTRAI